jgi:outer membrane protein assembly factor BamB
VVWISNLGQAHEEAEAIRKGALASGKMRGIPDANKYLDIADGVLFSYNLKGGVTGFSLETGEALWTVPSGGTVHRWRLGERERIIAQQGGEVVCIEPQTGAIVWKQGVRGRMLRLGVSGEHLVTSTGNHKAKSVRLHGYALAEDGLTERWTGLDAGTVVGWNCIAGDNLYAQVRNAEDKGHIVRVDLKAGSVAARRSFHWAGLKSASFVIEDRLLLNSDFSHATSPLWMFDATTLAPMGIGVWKQPHLQTSAYDVPMAVAYADGRLFFRGMKRIVCYDLLAAAKP